MTVHLRSKLAGVGRALLALTACAAASLCPGAARADDPPPSVLYSIPAFAQAADFKKSLADLGLTLQSIYTGETLANPSGGARQGAIYEGRLELLLYADMDKIAGWPGATLHAHGYWLQGTGLSRYYVQNFLAVSNIEALPSVRLYELWLEQKLDDDKLALRFGLLGADSEFAIGRYTLLFVNATVGWPDILGHDMPSGGPAVPLSALGFRARYDFNDNFALLAAIFDGDPAGPGPGDPQRRDPYGLNFRLSDPPLLMQEAQFNYNQGKSAAGLPGTIKIGAWEYFGNVANYRADPLGIQYNLTGLQPVSLLGDYGAYAMIDQLVLGTEDDPTKGVGVFARVFGAPSERNMLDFYCDGGVNVSGLVPGRPKDAFGLSFAYDNISAAIRDAAKAASLPVIPDHEILLELTYQAQILPGWTAQPVAEYVVHPAAGTGGFNLPNAVVIGLRTTLNF